MLNVKISWNFDTGVQKNIFSFLSNFAWYFFQKLWFPTYVNGVLTLVVQIPTVIEIV